MTRTIRGGAGVLALAVLAWGGPAWGQGATAGDDAELAAAREAAKLEARAAARTEALAILKRWSDFIGEQKRFSVKAAVGYDVVQPWGQKVEFGGTRVVTVRRPDRMHAELADRDGSSSTLVFDGTRISLSFAEEDAYVTVEKPGTTDAALDYLVEDLGTPAPMADFIHGDLYSEMAEAIQSGIYLGDETIGGVSCQHVAFRTAHVDWQAWVANGDRPLPRRIVITYKNAEGSPQFWAEFHEWNLSPEISDTLFTFEPPAGAEAIPIKTAIRRVRDDMKGE